MQPARRSKIKLAKVNQKPFQPIRKKWKEKVKLKFFIPGPVRTLDRTLIRSPTSCRRNARRAMSTAKAINVMRAARNDSKDAMSVIVTCWDNENSRAMNVTAAAMQRNTY